MQNLYAKYKQQSIVTMTQGDMINLLLDETINRPNKGLAGLEVGDCEATNTHFKKAQAIISHLASTLGPQYPVSKGLSSLYEYFNYQIIQANVRKNSETVNEILPMIEELREASTQADKQVCIGHTG